MVIDPNDISIIFGHWLGYDTHHRTRSILPSTSATPKWDIADGANGIAIHGVE